MAELVVATLVNVAIQTALAYAFPTHSSSEGARLDDLGVVGSAYGAGIPALYGRDRLPGNIIWATPMREEKRTDEYSAGKGSTITSTTYQYYATFAALLCAGDADLQPRRIWADKKLMWQAPDNLVHLAGDLSGGGAFEFCPGGPTQTRSAIMEGVLGTADTPAYRGRCLLVISELPVEQFGRRMPFVEVELANGVYNAPAIVSEVLLDLCTQAGLDPSEVDLSAVTDEVHGVRVMPGSAARTIATILDGLALQAINTGSQVAFRPIEQDVAGEVVEGELLAGERRFPIRRIREDALPRSVTVSHLDPDRDYQRGSQRQARQATRSVQATMLDAPIAMSATQAFAVADAMLYRSWTARTQFGAFGLLPRWLELEPGDRIGATVDGVRHDVRLTSLEIGAQGALSCAGEAYDAAVLVGASGGVPGTFPPQTLPEYGTTTLILLDVPALTDSEARQVGYRVAATGDGSAWRSGIVEASIDGGATWLQAATLTGYSVLGFAGSTPLPAPAVHVGASVIDTESTVDVTLVKGSLASTTDDLLIAGANRAMIGGEMIQFGVATLVSGTTYTLSRLLRGRRGTEGAMAGHVADETFVLLSSATFVPASVADLGAERTYRVTPSGGDPSGPQTFTILGASARPFAPVNITGSRDGGGNLSIGWDRCSRIGTELPNSGDIPLDEPTESYRVEIMDGGTVVRTIITTVPNWMYSAADQTTDFGSLQIAVAVRVRQIGQLVGSGTPAEATI